MRKASAITLIVLAVAGSVSAQSYPTKSLRIVTTEVSGSVDFGSRLLAQGLTANLGQSVIVENRSGGAGIIAATVVKNASPDGYTLLFQGSAFWTLPLMQTTPYDSLQDFAPVILAVQSPLVLLTNPAMQVNSLKELIALAKTKPGQLNYGQSTGSASHLAAELLKSMASIDVVHVPYKGGAPAIVDLMAGRIQLAFATPITVLPLIKSGKLRALGVTSAAPFALLPGVPAVSATIPGYEAVVTQGLFAPARVSKMIISRLNAESVKALTGPEVRDKFLSNGAVVVASSPEQFAVAIKSEMQRLGKVIRDAGISAQ
jgi:tripartite-type tricarboxylate transporter receptor subunit TctC